MTNYSLVQSPGSVVGLIAGKGEYFEGISFMNIYFNFTKNGAQDGLGYDSSVRGCHFFQRKLRQNMTDNVLTKCDRTFGENGANNGTVVTDTFSFNKESKKAFLNIILLVLI